MRRRRGSQTVKSPITISALHCQNGRERNAAAIWTKEISRARGPSVFIVQGRFTGCSIYVTGHYGSNGTGVIVRMGLIYI
jgi:hypothetical protein